MQLNSELHKLREGGYNILKTISILQAFFAKERKVGPERKDWGTYRMVFFTVR